MRRVNNPSDSAYSTYKDLEFIALLKNKGKMNADQIQDEIGCSITTVYRKMNKLEKINKIRKNKDDWPRTWEKETKLTKMKQLKEYLGLETEEEIRAEIKRRKRSLKVSKEYYNNLKGKKEQRVSKISDGSIITLFDNTDLPPKKDTDVICPHFMELKWANGCPFDCAWCYLQGTFRFLDRGKEPYLKDPLKVDRHLNEFFENADKPEILNTGELSDSLLSESYENPFSKYVLRKFKQNKDKKHRVLFLTKNSNVNNLIDEEFKNPDYAITSFTVNAKPVSKRWEKAPSPEDRIKAAKKVNEFGYETRIRIDPLVPIKGWSNAYKEIIDRIFDNLRPERITLGSLRGLSTTIREAKDNSWTKYLDESSNWGKKISLDTRTKMYNTIIEHLEDQWNYDIDNVGFCKETKKLWEEIGMNWKNITCNCVR